MIFNYQTLSWKPIKINVAESDLNHLIARFVSLCVCELWHRTPGCNVNFIHHHGYHDELLILSRADRWSDQSLSSLKTLRHIHACLFLSVQNWPYWCTEKHVKTNLKMVSIMAACERLEVAKHYLSFIMYLQFSLWSRQPMLSTSPEPFFSLNSFYRPHFFSQHKVSANTNAESRSAFPSAI